MIATVILLTLAYGIIIYLEVPRLLADKKWKHMAVFTLLLLPAMVYSAAMTFDVILPNPTVFITTIFKPLSEQLAKLLSTKQFGSY